jgi:D-threo-aldose 1-dehydrogenase
MTQPTRAIARSSLHVTEVGLGCAQLGNLYGAITDEEAVAIVDAAWDAGIRYFDVAPHYGLGLAEERLGKALAGRPRDQYVISTKVGRLLEPNPDFAGERDEDLFDVPARSRRRADYSRDGVLRSLDDSLNRLGLDRIDILYVHDADDHYREALDGAFPALDQLRSDGVISAYGAGMNQSRMLADFIRNTDANMIMVAGRYTLLDQTAQSDLLPEAERREVSIAAAGVFNSGLLASEEPSADAHFDYAAPPDSLVARSRQIAAVCSRFGVTLPQAAAQFPLRSPVVATVVLGADDPAQVHRNAALLSPAAPAELWDELRRQGLIGDEQSAQPESTR